MEKSSDVSATMYFLLRDPCFDTVKPYSIQYEPHGDTPQTNIERDEVSGVHIRDLRPIVADLSFESDGMVVRNLESKMSYEDFAQPEIVRSIYLKEIQSLLQTTLDSKNVAILEYLIRRRHKEFPLAPEDNFEFAQPVATAHIDFSPAYIHEILLDRYGEGRTEELAQCRYSVIKSAINQRHELRSQANNGSAWKPLKGPVQDWPLALCHPSSLNTDTDFELSDNVFPLTIEESIQIYHNEAQKWCYLSDQTDAEVLIFRGGDSELGIRGGIPHCSFENPKCPVESSPRESVEVRALVFYSDQTLALDRLSESRLHGPKASFRQRPVWGLADSQQGQLDES